jgi:hypothetical protein
MDSARLRLHRRKRRRTTFLTQRHEIGNIGEAYSSHPQMGSERVAEAVQGRFSYAGSAADTLWPVKQVTKTIGILVCKYPPVASSVLLLL